MKNINKLYKNFLSLTFGEIVSKVLVFFSVVYLAKVLGAEGYGTVDFIIAILSYFLLFVNAGFDTFGAREIARNHVEAKRYVSNIVMIRLIIALICYFILSGIIVCLPKTLEFKKIFFLYGFTLFSFAINLKWVFIGLEKTKAVAISLILYQTLFVTSIVLLINDRSNLIHIPIIHLSAEIFVALFLIAVFVKKYGLFLPKIDIPFWMSILRQSLPLCITMVVGMINYNFDIIMIGFIKNEESVGWYSAAYKVVLLFLAVCASYFSVILPSVSRYYNRALDGLRERIGISIRFTSAIGVPIAFGGAILAYPIINLIYGTEYSNSVPVLRLLIITVFIIILRINYRVLLIGLNKQTLDLKCVSFSLVVNVVLNLILIPLYGLIGAAIATVCSELVCFILAYFYVRKYIIHIPFIKNLVKPTFSAIIMSGALYFVKEMSLFISLTVGICSYSIVLALLKGITRDDLRTILRKA